MSASLWGASLRRLVHEVPRAVVLPRRGRPDPWLLLAVALLLGLGWVLVLNATYFRAAAQGDPLLFARRHTISLATGVGLAFLAARIRVDAWQRYARGLLFLTVAFLLLVLLAPIGQERGGARRWLAYGPLSFQPAEMAKLTLTLYLARFLSLRPAGARDLVADVLPPLTMAGIVATLVLVQPDFGTSMILLATAMGLLFAAGTPLWFFASLATSAALVASAAVWMAPYRMRRVLCFVDPWQDPRGDCFQLVQSLLSFGVGSWWGVGLGESRQKLFFLPEAHTDFIFALVGEELGLVGVGAVVLLFVMLTVRGFRVAYRETDPFAHYLALGLTLSLALEAVLNMGVVLGMLPTKGLVLPFVSYGGSALWFSLVRVGILLNLSRRAG